MKNLNCVLLVFVFVFAKAQAEQCEVGVDGCLWTCSTVTPEPGHVQCLAKIVVPKCCDIGSSQTVCGTTCICSKADICTVGVNGCQWTCVNKPNTGIHCLAIIDPPSECYPGQTFSDCFKTCTCGIGCSAS